MVNLLNPIHFDWKRLTIAVHYIDISVLFVILYDVIAMLLHCDYDLFCIDVKTLLPVKRHLNFDATGNRISVVIRNPHRTCEYLCMTSTCFKI